MWLKETNSLNTWKKSHDTETNPDFLYYKNNHKSKYFNVNHKIDLKTFIYG